MIRCNLSRFIFYCKWFTNGNNLLLKNSFEKRLRQKPQIRNYFHRLETRPRIIILHSIMFFEINRWLFIYFFCLQNIIIYHVKPPCYNNQIIRQVHLMTQSTEVIITVTRILLLYTPRHQLILPDVICEKKYKKIN